MRPFGLLSRTVLFSALICSLQFTSQATSYASQDIEQNDFAGSNTLREGETGCDWQGTVPEGKYAHIYGGYSNISPSTESAIATGNTLTLTSKHNCDDTTVTTKINGGYAGQWNNILSDKINAQASSNTVILKDGYSYSNSKGLEIAGGAAWFRGGENEASNNTVEIENSSLTGASIYGGRASKSDGSSDATDTTITVSNNTVTIKDTVTIAAGDINDSILGGRIASKNNNDTGCTIAKAENNSIKAALKSTQDSTGYTGNNVYGSLILIGNTSTKNDASASKNSIELTNGTYKAVNGGRVEMSRSVNSTDYLSGTTGGKASASNNGDYTGDDGKKHVGLLTNVTADSFAGGYIDMDTGEADASTNIFTLDGGSYKDVTGGHAVTTQEKTTDNKVSADANAITAKGAAFSGGSVAGGLAETKGSGNASAAKNSLSLASGSYAAAELYAGKASVNGDGTADASSNGLSVENTADAKISTLYGGKAEVTGSGTATASNNGAAQGLDGVLTNVSADTLFAGGYASVDKGSAEASTNIFAVTGTTFKDIYGGYAEVKSDGKDGKAQAAASSNSLELTAATISGDIYGGLATLDFEQETAAAGTASADSNTLSITQTDNGSAGSVYGGKASAKNVAKDSKASASSNTLTIKNGIYKDVYAGYASLEGEGTAESSSNTLDLYGGTYNGEVYAGCSSASTGTATSQNNTLSLWTYEGKSPTFDEQKTTIWGGRSVVGGTDGASTGNTIEFHNVQGMTAANIKNFEKYVFELPDMKADAAVLTLTGGENKEKTDISGATVEVTNKTINLTGANGGEFKKGDKVYLLKNSNGITTKGYIPKASLTGQAGISVRYNLEMGTDIDENGEATAVYLTRTSDSSVAPETKAVAEGAASGMALANEAANTAVEAAGSFSPQAGIIAPFGHAQGSSASHETGSHVDVTSVSIVAGLGTGVETSAGKLSLGAFFEYGRGSYTTHNSIAGRSDVEGDGTSWYMGGGIMGKMDFKDTGPGHFYVEGSAHMGQMHNEYESSDIRDANGRATEFDMDSPYFTLHGGLGYVWNVAEDHDLDVYGKYIWTRVQGTDETLSTGDEFEFDDMNSYRLRLGARYSYKGNEHFQPYIGAAWEHEFGGSCDSTAYGHPVAAPSFEGDTGIGEIGVTLIPSSSVPISISLGVEGYVGKKQGGAGNCVIMYEF